MYIQHIQNCIKMIKRSEYHNYRDLYKELPELPLRYVVDYKLYEPYLEIFKKELESR